MDSGYQIGAKISGKTKKEECVANGIAKQTDKRRDFMAGEGLGEQYSTYLRGSAFVCCQAPSREPSRHGLKKMTRLAN